jgi:hypothetical protein
MATGLLHCGYVLPCVLRAYRKRPTLGFAKAMERLRAEIAQRPMREMERVELSRKHRAIIQRAQARQALALKNARRELGW